MRQLRICISDARSLAHIPTPVRALYVLCEGDVDLEAKLGEWERFYNFHRPHGAHNEKTPYEALRENL